MAYKKPEVLMGISLPDNAPKWMTYKYVASCVTNKVVQRRWKPEVGDWYICRDLSRILKIDSLGHYYADPQFGSPGVLSSDSHIGSDGRWPCDTYIPDPSRLEKILRRHSRK